MAECKNTNAKFDHLDRWIENTKRMFSFSKGDLAESLFVTTEKMTDECLNHLETSHDINKKGQLKVVSGIRVFSQTFNDNKQF